MDDKMLDLSNVWSEWTAVKKVGEGSFGKVFKCVRKEYDIETECAIKVVSIPQSESEINAIRSEFSSEESVKAHFREIVDEFANEIKMMVLLKGAPNIVSVENYKIVERKDTIGWDIYIQMEFLTTFSEFARNNAFTERAVARLATDICSALEICGEKNIIHRDIKPDNIFIDNYGNYKIGDFGVARKLENASNAMSKKGTYTYMAPEVYHGGAYDGRADIYSLGMVMYKLLNRGRDPFTDPLAENIAYRDREAALVNRMRGENLPAPVDASLGMSKIIIKACAFDPNKRFATPSEFKAALREYITNAPRTGNNFVDSTNGFNGKNGGKEFSMSKSNKSLPLFTDDILHDKSKQIVHQVPQNTSTSPVNPSVNSSVARNDTVDPALCVNPPAHWSAASLNQSVRSAEMTGSVKQPDAPEAPKKKSKGKLFVVIGILIAVIAAVAVVVFLNKDTINPTPLTTAATTQPDNTVASEVKKYTANYFKHDYDSIKFSNYISERKVSIDGAYIQVFTADVVADGVKGFLLAEVCVADGEVISFDYVAYEENQRRELYSEIEEYNSEHTDKDLKQLLKNTIEDNQ